MSQPPTEYELTLTNIFFCVVFYALILVITSVNCTSVINLSMVAPTGFLPGMLAVMNIILKLHFIIFLFLFSFKLVINVDRILIAELKSGY